MNPSIEKNLRCFVQRAPGSLAAKCSTVSTNCSLTVSVCCFLLSKATDRLLQLLQHLEKEAEQSGAWLKNPTRCAEGLGSAW